MGTGNKELDASPSLSRDSEQGGDEPENDNIEKDTHTHSGQELSVWEEAIEGQLQAPPPGLPAEQTTCVHVLLCDHYYTVFSCGMEHQKRGKAEQGRGSMTQQTRRTQGFSNRSASS